MKISYSEKDVIGILKEHAMAHYGIQNFTDEQINISSCEENKNIMQVSSIVFLYDEASEKGSK